MQYGMGGGPAKFALLACMCMSIIGKGKVFFAGDEVLVPFILVSLFGECWPNAKDVKSIKNSAPIK